MIPHGLPSSQTARGYSRRHAFVARIATTLGERLGDRSLTRRRGVTSVMEIYGVDGMFDIVVFDGLSEGTT